VTKWTIQSLKEYFEGLNDEREKRYQEAFKASQTAIDKAETAQQLRNASQNEWREQNKDILATLEPRKEAESARASMEAKLEAQIQSLRNETGIKFDALDKSQRDEKARADKTEGKFLGISLTTGAIVTIIFIAIGIAGLLVHAFLG
jgi:transketolase